MFVFRSDGRGDPRARLGRGQQQGIPRRLGRATLNVLEADLARLDSATRPLYGDHAVAFRSGAFPALRRQPVSSIRAQVAKPPQGLTGFTRSSMTLPADRPQGRSTASPCRPDTEPTSPIGCRGSRRRVRSPSRSSPARRPRSAESHGLRGPICIRIYVDWRRAIRSAL